MASINRRDVVTVTLQVIVIIAGELLNVVAFRALIVPAKLLSGGVVGMALLLNQLFGLPIGLQTLIYNIPIFIWGYRVLGRRFILLSIVGVGSFSVLMDNVQLPPVTNEMVLIAIFGGVITGIADGLIMRTGGSTGGFDIIGLIVSRRSGFPAGQIFIFSNAIIIGIGALASGNIETAMFTLIMLYVASRVIDTFLSPTPRRALLIISNKHEQIADKFLSALHRGVTYLEGVGAYTGQEFRVLMCVITRFELVEARQTIREIDPDAFTVVLEASDVMGRFDSKSPLQWLGR
ncbi:MAG: YitT family protein [Anaerolineae bacterium]|nr:YitT family protein [Anaerolineae bacterium]